MQFDTLTLWRFNVFHNSNLEDRVAGIHKKRALNNVTKYGIVEDVNRALQFASEEEVSAGIRAYQTDKIRFCEDYSSNQNNLMIGEALKEEIESRQHALETLNTGGVQAYLELSAQHK